MKKESFSGYPSLDRPWEKYYRDSPVRDIETNQTIYELIFNSNIDSVCSLTAQAA